MSKKEIQNTEQQQEKIITRYDRKLQKRKEQKEKEKRERRIMAAIGIVIAAALVCLIASFPIRTYLATHSAFIQVGGESVTRVEFDYHYNIVRNNYLMQNGTYMSYFGLDLTGDLSTQMYSDTLTWQDYFEQLAVENLYWRTQADRRRTDILCLTLAFLLLLWLVTIVGLLYRRSRKWVKLQQRRLHTQAEALEQERETSSRHLQRVAEMERKEACLKETFFRRLSQRVFQEIERGGNIILSDEDWDDIVQNANSIFDGFTNRLQQRYPALNKEDLRYCCMVKMQLSQAVMAQIMHLEKDSVKKRLKRIRTEKMGAEGGITLEDLLREF